MKPAVIYSDRYEADIGAHVFPTEKYRLTLEALLRDGLVTRDEVIEPPMPSDEDLLLTLEPEYLEDLRKARRTPRTLYSELPVERAIIDSQILGAGGTLEACRLARGRGAGIHVGGGLHHGFADHGEGFCYVNDLAVGIRKALAAGWATRVAVIDCDLHQGNGTAKIFRKDDRVYTFSIHQERLYPEKEASDLDIGLDDFTRDDVYLAHLARTVPAILADHAPDLVVYQAGADPYEKDLLGHLRITLEGLEARDGIVIGECRKRGIPFVVTLGGGYAEDTADTVEIHANTCRVALGARPA
jgi:acetoin utilization deacetylase AcuC-like enzyme